MPITIDIPGCECWDPVKEEFIRAEPTKIFAEHSLVSISKWESKWKIPFLDNKKKTSEQYIDYIKCMTLNTVDDSVYYRLTSEDISKIDEYISDPMTATWVNEKRTKGGRNNRIITSELIYCFMVLNGIPFECENWHLNRLIMLIRVCNAENSPKQQMSKQDLYKQYAATNAIRRRAHKH